MTSSVDGSVEPRLSVVIAAFNEENNLSALVDEINAVCDERGWVREIIVVDDGSTDESARRGLHGERHILPAPSQLWTDRCLRCRLSRRQV
ncbi:glycosyltransferase family 2 protein [Bradyrhizobium manausense]|uniref:Glycosyltransferase 2-like domain-containing protein n=1 Tax=Bradyrhizobium manausense TaxID=989370 RepID=A0A0R3DJX1_9BRAD|nr:glycosyltransferase [Bradyrhizobium manausense]KRQ10134.1 hypothetical protein AOQ71_19365 [Bradyrhizobium manausense]